MTSVQRGRDNTERLRELAARIAAEHEHDKSTELVNEFNETPRRQTRLSGVTETP